MFSLLTVQNRKQNIDCNIEDKEYTMLQSYRKYIQYYVTTLNENHEKMTSQFD